MNNKKTVGKNLQNSMQAIGSNAFEMCIPIWCTIWFTNECSAMKSICGHWANWQNYDCMPMLWFGMEPPYRNALTHGKWDTFSLFKAFNFWFHESIPFLSLFFAKIVLIWFSRIKILLAKFIHCTNRVHTMPLYRFSYSLCICCGRVSVLCICSMNLASENK